MKENIFDNRIYYRKNDWQEGRITLILIHGVSGSSSAWWPYEKIFESKYNLLTYDIRGHGMSKKYANYTDYEVTKFAEDLHQLLEFLGCKHVVLVSNSFGGLVVLEYLKSWRTTVAGVVFTSPEVYLNQGFVATIMRGGFNVIKFIVSMLPSDAKPRGHVDYSKHPNSTDWNIKRNLADMKNTGFRTHFYTLRQSFNRDYEYALENIDVPTLVMHGVKDSMVPLKNAIRMSSKITNSKFISIENVDHNTAHNAVKEMSGAIESFVESHKAEFSKNL